MPFTMLRFERVEANCAAENDKEMIDFAQPPLSSADLSRCVGYFRNSNATETKIASSAFPTIILVTSEDETITMRRSINEILKPHYSTLMFGEFTEEQSEFGLPGNPRSTIKIHLQRAWE